MDLAKGVVMVKSNVRPFVSLQKAGQYALLTEEQFRDGFKAYKEAEQDFAKIQTEVNVFLLNGEPVPAVLVERLDEKRRISDRLRNPLMVANMRLVHSICKRYTGRGVEYLDIVQDAVFGLVKAIERFELEREITFSTYATHWIRCYARTCVERQSSKRMVHVPTNHLSREFTLSSDLEAFERKHGHSPSGAELRAFTKHKTIAELNEKQLQALRENPTVGITSSLDAPVTGHDVLSRISLLRSHVPDPETLLIAKQRLAELQKEILKVVTRIPPKTNKSNAERDEMILRMRYGLNPGSSPQTLEEVGEAFGLTRERVRQIVNRRLACHDLTTCSFEAKLHDMLILFEALSDIG